MESRRIRRERRTIEVMIRLYCRDHHNQGGVCSDCQELLDYAHKRLECCPFGSEKPACSKCPIHCYKPLLRDKIRKIMAYSGPRMLVRHPILAICHIWDTIRKVPERRKKTP